MTTTGHPETSSSPEHAAQGSTDGAAGLGYLVRRRVTRSGRAGSLHSAKGATKGSARSRMRLWLAAGVFVAAVSFILTQGLGNATLYFRTGDEAVGQRGALGDRRFRIQGDVMAESVSPTTQGVSFTLTSNDVEVQVRHSGDPPELFKPGIPVVLEGSVYGDAFVSDRMLMKHSETYSRQKSTAGGGASLTSIR